MRMHETNFEADLAHNGLVGLRPCEKALHIGLVQATDSTASRC